MTAFEGFLCRTFEVSKLERRSLSVMGCSISQDADYSVTLDQNQKLNELDPSVLINSIREPKDGPASAHQAKLYRHIIGQMLYIGRLSAPLMLYHASAAATKLPDLKLHQLRALASTVTGLKQQGTELKFLSPASAPSVNAPFVLDCISDGTTASGTDIRGREGHIMFSRSGAIAHPILWSARKLRRVSRSSSTAETPPLTRAPTRCTCTPFSKTSSARRPPAEQTVDSSSLHSLSTSIKEPEERTNKDDLAAIREAYDMGYTRVVLWCPGTKLLADPLTKNNRRTTLSRPAFWHTPSTNGDKSQYRPPHSSATIYSQFKSKIGKWRGAEIPT